MIKFILKTKIPKIAVTTLKKINKIGIFTLPNFKTYSKATVIRTVW